MQRSIALIMLMALLTMIALPSVTAHETYFSSDGSIRMVLGEKDEPVYTYDFTNLDLSVSDNETGDPIEGVEESLEATLLAPNGQELSHPLAPQFRSPGSYEFEEEYILTLPGQYSLRLEGSINGVDVSDEYLLPGPRGDSTNIFFPHTDIKDLRALQQENDELRQRIEALEAGDSSDGGGAAPGLTILPLLVAAGLALALRRRGA